MSAIGIALILLILVGPYLKGGAAWAYAAAKSLVARLPSAGGIGGIFTAKVEIPIWKAALLVVAFWMISAGGSISLPQLPGLPGWSAWLSFSQKVTAATYVYEKDDGGIPDEVQTGLDRLNRERKILATFFEQNTVDGTGEVPDQYKAPLEAAKKAGLPSLVATAGVKVVRVVKNPTTEAAVMEAAK